LSGGFLSLVAFIVRTFGEKYSSFQIHIEFRPLEAETHAILGSVRRGWGVEVLSNVASEVLLACLI
jgi:hypothetical protein